MSLKDLNLKREYRSCIDDIAKKFYIPVLNEGNQYDRAVGFFSSSIFSQIYKGINSLIKNGGRVRIIASPNLSEKDIVAIREGYAKRDEIIKNSLLRELKKPINAYEEEQLNYMANLIADGYLDIRIAFVENDIGFGIYHEKVGIVHDSSDNIVVFTGSPNESATAIVDNYETMDVYVSWVEGSEKDRITDKLNAFEAIWNDIEPRIKTLEFKNVTDEFVKRYKTKSVDYHGYTEIDSCIEVKEKAFFRIPENIELHEYQIKAIDNWFTSQNCGIFDMATGTGKTYTALGALSSLSKALNDDLAVIIVVPYQHLVEQWVEDINNFNVQPIKAYSYAGNKWRKEFQEALNLYNRGIVKNFCVVATIATFISDDFQKLINGFTRNFCFVADEAHNFGAQKIRNILPLKARYRIGLSATIERYGDEDGTEALRKFFGKTSIKFTLKDAIINGFLTKYYYKPVINYLSQDEYDEYEELTKKVTKLGKSSHEEFENSDYLKMLLIKRTRIISGCKDKIKNIAQLMEEHKKENYMLVYCGTNKYESSITDCESDIKQIELITKRISDIGLRVRKFTSFEDRNEREEIKAMFSTGFQIQVITAIKCLDEGVNIPNIRKAFILASSTNPKEYVQRRGRVLRKAPGKKFAEIFDFITLPRKLNEVKYIDSSTKKCDMTLIKKEIDRMREFAEAAENTNAVDDLIESIYQAYGIL